MVSHSRHPSRRQDCKGIHQCRRRLCRFVPLEYFSAQQWSFHLISFCQILSYFCSSSSPKDLFLKHTVCSNFFYIFVPCNVVLKRKKAQREDGNIEIQNVPREMLALTMSCQFKYSSHTSHVKLYLIVFKYLAKIMRGGKCSFV